MRHAATDLYADAFHAPPDAVASAPGRVNLIGEHTDYNGGPVLPLAIARRTVVAAGAGEDGVLELVSARRRAIARVQWRDTLPNDWTGYLVGVMRELAAQDGAPTAAGARVAVAGDLPSGAGLASSAALTVAAAAALARAFSMVVAPRALAGIAYRAEHVHVGVRCGVMDPLIAVLGKAGHALLIECATLATRAIPCGVDFLLVDTGVRHALRNGVLNTRRRECEAAVQQLKVALPELRWLARWPVAWLARLKRDLPAPLRQRATHVVAESARTRFAAELLEQRKWTAFGRLMFESHESCRELYDCSSKELDLVVAAARRAGALGARLTGAGWGGAAIVLTKRDEQHRQRVMNGIRRAFKRAYKREPGLEWVAPSAGLSVASGREVGHARVAKW